MCNKEHVVGYLYDELSPADRLAFEAHVRECAECRAEVGELRRTRQHLALWAPSEPEFNFRIVRESVPLPRRRFGFVPQWGLAAAASIFLLAGALAIANVEIRRTSDGFVVRTGWAQDAAPQPGAAAVGSGSAGIAQTAAATGASDELKARIATLEQRLAAFEQEQTAQLAKASAGGRPGMSAAEVRQILTAVESRLRTETALQIRQVWADVNTARVNDLQRVEKTMNRQQGFTNLQLQQNRDAIDFVRTSAFQQK